MKNKIFALCITFLMLLGNIPAKALSEPLRVYVSPFGNDNNSGSIEQPLKTLAGAKSLVRKKKGNDSVEVIFREGEYRFTNGVQFTEEDSGTEEGPITYKAYDGEKVVFKGSFAFDAEKRNYVTDKEILKRVDLGVRNYLVCYDLNKLGYTYGVPNTSKIEQFQFLMYPKEEEFINLYLDDKEQMISQWPNGDDEFVSWVEAVEKGNAINTTQKGGSFKYSGARPDRWKDADNFWIGGYPGYNFRYERNAVESIDTDNRIIKLKTNTCFGIVSQESKAWKAFNLLEEIDVPGEWFLDKNTNILYYYPPYGLKDKTLEISFLAEPFFDLKKVSYINIENIEFAQHRATAIIGTNVSHINIDGCTFRNIDGYGVKTTGDIRTKYKWSRFQNAAKDFHVKNCTFDNIGASSICLESGNIDTLERGDSSFENNLVMRASTKYKNAEAIVLYGVGNTIKNNSISSTGFHGITYYGSDHKILNNEFYDVNKSSDDAGAIYCVRDYCARGTEIAYNYIHDTEAHRNISRGFTIAIYWDDSNPGQAAHHNFIVNNAWTLVSSGHMNNFEHNIIVNGSTGGMNIYNRSGWTMGKDHTALLADKQIYFDHFPTMEETINEKYKGKMAYCKVIGNLSVNTPKNRIDDLMLSTVKDNIEVEACDDFVDPEHQDYRIKSGSETAKMLPGLLNEKFDIDSVGIVGRNYEFNENTASFNKLYPHNNQTGIAVPNTEFAWERVFGANEYRLVVAKDKELKDIVFDETVAYNIEKVPGLSSNTKYYWQVWAKNTSRQFNSEWKAVGDVYEFRTAIYSDIDTLELKKTVQIGENRLERSIESEKAGDYKKGSLDEIRKYLVKGNVYFSLPIGKINQSEVDELNKNINDFWNKTENINPGFIDLMSLASKPEDWMPVSNGSMDSDGNLILDCPSGVRMIYAESFKNLSENCILKFKTKVETSEWVGVGLMSKDVYPWMTENPSYFIAVKDGFIELQKNPGGIVEIADAKVVNDGKYHEYEFGAIRLMSGKLFIVRIDGKTVFEYVDGAPVENKLMPMFLIANKGKFIISKSDSKVDDSEYYELIEKNINNEAKKIHDEYDKVASDLVIFKNGSKIALTQDGLKNIEGGFKNIEGKNYISKELSDALFGTIDYTEATESVNGDAKFYQLSELAAANKLRVDYDDVTGLIFVSPTGIQDNLTNMVLRLNTTKRFFDNYEKNSGAK